MDKKKNQANQIPFRGGLRQDVKPTRTDVAGALLARGVSPQGYELTYVLVIDNDTKIEKTETR